MIILIGASASGKTEIVKEMVKNHGYLKLVTNTSREMRVGEVEGKDYHFITKETFQNKLNNNEFFEYVTYNGNLYGTLKEDITDNKIVILEPSGFKAYHESNLKNIVSFFLYTDEETRKRRMEERGDLPEKIIERLLSDRTHFDSSKIDGLDYILDTSNMSVKDLSDMIDILYRKKLEG